MKNKAVILEANIQEFQPGKCLVTIFMIFAFVLTAQLSRVFAEGAESDFASFNTTNKFDAAGIEPYATDNQVSPIDYDAGNEDNNNEQSVVNEDAVEGVSLGSIQAAAESKNQEAPESIVGTEELMQAIGASSDNASGAVAEVSKLEERDPVEYPSKTLRYGLLEVTQAPFEVSSLLLENPSQPNPQVATDVPGAYIGFDGIVRPDTALQSLKAQENGEDGSLADITLIGANKKGIAELNAGMNSLSSDKKKEYILAHVDEYKEKKAGSISDGNGGDVIVNPEVFVKQPGFNPNAIFYEAEYYRGNIGAGDQQPVYTGSIEDILKTMLLYSENAIGRTKEKIEEIVRPVTILGEDPRVGTVVRVAKAGPYETYLTNSHVIGDLSPDKDDSIRFIDSDFKKVGRTELDAADVFHLYGQTKRFGEGYDTALFNIYNQKNEVNLGDRIEVVPVAEENPVFGSNLLLYSRPQAGRLDDDQLRHIQVEVLGRPSITMFATSKSDLFQGKVLMTDASLRPGLSGTPVFLDQDKLIIAGLNFRSIDDKTKGGYAIMPTNIRKFIEESRDPDIKNKR